MLAATVEQAETFRTMGIAVKNADGTLRPAADVPEAFWNIGIRIEDDAIVTPDGCELITRGVPVRADEIEALMRG